MLGLYTTAPRCKPVFLVQIVYYHEAVPPDKLFRKISTAASFSLVTYNGSLEDNGACSLFHNRFRWVPALTLQDDLAAAYPKRRISLEIRTYVW